ncbi:PEP-CTERM sorting domain-containing protein [Luteolibacter sp. SL250]|uniref:PEP-CTERM sorting domain-containing protein n=1 Tax=Luteolibacter sp. SL250 TaxID=2995170 RepID=UPI00226FFD7F|nr:PEP-CTERM sorting domain-containing protein [Luteolibacter sp. SL250]WAC18833.1 PEP-CTERM sorting domain-containing protein [Luteolibacter sp. SL250]
MSTTFPPRTLLLLAALAGGAALPAQASTILYSGFGDSTVGATAPAGWTRVANSGSASSTITADHHFSQNAPSNGQNTLSLFNTGSGISRAAGDGFRLTSTFSATSGSAQYENTAFFFMAPSDGANAPRVNFNMGYSNTGLLEFSNVTTNVNDTFGGTAYNALEPQNPIYTFTLTGIFQANGNLNLTATLANSVNSTVLTSTGTLNAASATGTYFGIRTAAGGEGSGHAASSVHRSYLLEAIPEPSSAMLLLGGAMATLARRRRRG